MKHSPQPKTPESIRARPEYPKSGSKAEACHFCGGYMQNSAGPEQGQISNKIAATPFEGGHQRKRPSISGPQPNENLKSGNKARSSQIHLR
jgi:hypothetical protein